MKHLSSTAQSIIDAAMTAAGDERSEDAFLKADRAIEWTVGQLGLQVNQDEEVVMIESLIEIAQLHVREHLKA